MVIYAEKENMRMKSNPFCYAVPYLLVFIFHMDSVSCKTEAYQYTLHVDKLNWNEAHRNCRRMNRNLLNLKTAKQQRTIVEITTLWEQNNKIEDKYWIGGFHYVNTSTPDLDGWYWDDCTLIGESSHWAKSTHDDSKQNCVFRSKHDETWFTDRCDNVFQYICQIKIGECWFEDRKGEKLIDAAISNQVVINKSPRSIDDCKKYCQDYDDPEEDCTSFTNKENECLIILGSYTSGTFLPTMDKVPSYTTFIKRCYAANADGDAATDSIRGFVGQYDPQPLCQPTTATTSTTLAPTTTTHATKATATATSFPEIAADTTNIAESTIVDTTVELTTIDTQATPDSTTVDSTSFQLTTIYSITTAEATTSVESITLETLTTDLTTANARPSAASATEDITATAESTTKDTTTVVGSTDSDTTTATTPTIAGTSTPVISTSEDTTADTRTTVESTNYGTAVPAELLENTDTPAVSTILILPVNKDTTSKNLTPESSSNQNAGISGIGRFDRPLCGCRCKRNGSRLRLKNIISYLTIDEKVLSANVRRKISISDERPSAVGLGVLGITLLVATISFFIISDTTRFIFNGQLH